MQPQEASLEGNTNATTDFTNYTDFFIIKTNP